MRLLRLWLFVAGLFPAFLYLQARHAKRHAIRLPEAEGPRHGLSHTTEEQPLHVVVLGESSVAGVGVRHQNEGLAAQVALVLSERLHRPVKWFAYGKNGARLAEVCMHLLPQHLHEADLVLVSIGVNDTTKMSSLKHWREQLEHLVARVRQQTTAPIRFLTLPPMQHMTALPQPLRHVVSLRARMLDKALRDTVTRLADCAVIDYHTPMEARFLAIDGYHPSAAGYREMALNVADAITGKRRCLD